MSDLTRLHEFLEPVTATAAARVIQQLTAAPTRLLEHQRISEKLEQFSPREVLRILINDYELRYSIQGDTMYLLRVWHAREDR